MEWLRENWFWIAVLILFVWFHMKMHGGHGGHGNAQTGGQGRRRGPHAGHDTVPGDAADETRERPRNGGSHAGH